MYGAASANSTEGKIHRVSAPHCTHPAKGSEPWIGDRLETTQFHEIAEICKTGIRQLLRLPYDSGRKSC
jgi:hypothetical protein